MSMADEKASPPEASGVGRSNSTATTIPATTPELQANGFEAVTGNGFI